MIRIASQPQSTTPAWHTGFLTMLPTIVAHARIAFRFRTPEAREESIAECVANALVAYARLVELGKVALAYPTVLARYAVAQVKEGRKVGGHLNIQDVLSPYCQRRKDVNVESMDRFDDTDGEWQEAVVQDTRSAPVPDIVSFRIDFADWLGELPRRNRRIAEALAVGNATGEVAQRFDVSPGRVSQLRRDFQESWKQFIDEAEGSTVV